MDKRIKDLAGKRFGRLLIIDLAYSGGHAYWNAVCDCGKTSVHCAGDLSKGRTLSCGCLRKERLRLGPLSSTTHGMSKTLIYHLWNGMVDRCTNPKNDRFKDYGGRGITVDPKWLKFTGFYEDMCPRPGNKSLDRIKTNGDYTKDNCRWATPKEQQNNARNNVIIEFEGVTLPETYWAERVGIKKCTLHARLLRGWPIARALTEPAHLKAGRTPRTKGMKI